MFVSKSRSSSLKLPVKTIDFQCRCVTPVTKKEWLEKLTSDIYQNLLGTTRRIVSLHRALSTRQLYSRDHILRFNLSIVPGITEFRRKNNAYCGTHKAVGHKTLMSGRANGAQARTTCIFMSTTRSVRGFFPGLVSLRVEPHNVRHTYARARTHVCTMRSLGNITIVNLQYCDGWLDTISRSIVSALELRKSLCKSRFHILYKFTDIYL